MFSITKALAANKILKSLEKNHDISFVVHPQWPLGLMLIENILPIIKTLAILDN